MNYYKTLYIGVGLSGYVNGNEEVQTAWNGLVQGALRGLRGPREQARQDARQGGLEEARGGHRDEDGSPAVWLPD